MLRTRGDNAEMGRGDAGLEYRPLAVAGVRAAVPAGPGHRPHPPTPGRHRHPAGDGDRGILILFPARVSGGAAVPSGLEKRLTATTEALMMAAGEPAGAGRA